MGWTFCVVRFCPCGVYGVYSKQSSFSVFFCLVPPLAVCSCALCPYAYEKCWFVIEKDCHKENDMARSKNSLQQLNFGTNKPRQKLMPQLFCCLKDSLFNRWQIPSKKIHRSKKYCLASGAWLHLLSISCSVQNWECF